MFCPACGASIADDSAFCPLCGAQVGNPPQVVGSQAAPPPAQASAAQFAPVQPQAFNVAAGQSAAMQANAQAASGAMKPAKSPARALVPIVAVAVLVVGGIAFAASSLFGGGIGSVARNLFGGGIGSAEALCDSFEKTVNELYADDFTVNSIAAYTNETLNYMPKGAVDAIVAQGGYSSQEEAVADIFGGSTLGNLSGTDESAWDEALEFLNTLLSSVEITVDLYPGSSLDELEVSQLENEFSNLGLNYNVQEACWIQGTSTVTALEDYYTLSAGETQTSSWSEIENCLAVKIDGSWYLWVERDL